MNQREVDVVQAASGPVRSRTIRIDGGDDQFHQCEKDTVLRAALRSDIGFPYECNSGGCGSCKFILIEGEVENLWAGAPGLTDRDRRKGQLLACQCRAVSDLRIKVRAMPEYQARIAPARRRAKLVGTLEITHDIREFRFASEGPATFLPGQYASIAMPGLESPRSYSMSNLPNPNGHWQFQVRRVPNGKASDLLFETMRAGDEIEIDGPFGFAYLRSDSPRDIVCIAGGSGLAPIVSIVRGAAAEGMLKTRHLHVFYGGRTPRDIFSESLLERLPDFADKIHIHPVVSAPDPEAVPRWKGSTGFVHEIVESQLGDRLNQFEFYFAGPPPMTQAVQELLMVKYRVPFSRVHFDRFY